MTKAACYICLVAIAILTPGIALAGGRFYLADGTPVKLRLSETISSETAHVNDNVNFQTIDAVRVNGVTVIPKGALAIGTVTAVKPKRRLARGGKLDVTIDYVRLADGEKAALRAVKDVKGGGHTGAMTGAIVVTGLLVWPAAPFFLFMHGKSITIPEGTEITAFVNGDMDLDPQKFSLVLPAINGPGAQPPRGEHALSSVVVNSIPNGADITVDGKYMGSTPSKLKLSPGGHAVLIQEQGYPPWQRTVTVAPGEQITISATLNKKPSTEAH